MPDLSQYCNDRLQALEAQHARRHLRAVPPGLVSFASNDYFGLSTHPVVVEAARAAMADGAGAGASRLVTGNHAHFAPLEAKLAAIHRQPSALVFGSGYLANLGTITALMGPGDLILADKLVHACMIDGAQLSGATLKRFRHNDVLHAEALLTEYRGQYDKVLIATEHVFSMDGDRAPIAALEKLAMKYDCWLMVDDAHGLHDEPDVPVDIWMGTLSKAAGSYGGYIAASQPVIDYLLTAARSFVFSTGLPPAACAAALAALSIAEAEPERRARPVQLARRVTQALGLTEAQSAIIPIILGSSEAALAASEALKRHGMLAVAIRPPTVPPGTARLRLTFSANHTDAQVDALIAALKHEGIGA